MQTSNANSVCYKEGSTIYALAKLFVFFHILYVAMYGEREREREEREQREEEKGRDDHVYVAYVLHPCFQCAVYHPGGNLMKAHNHCQSADPFFDLDYILMMMGMFRG